MGTNTWSFVLLGGFFVVMMLLTILPQKKRQKKMKEMISALRVGSKIKTIGGFVGVIVSMNDSDDTIVINIGSEKDPVNATISRMGIYMSMDTAPTVSNGYNNDENKPSI